VAERTNPTEPETESIPPEENGVAREVGRLLLAVGCLGVMGYMAWRGGNFAKQVPMPSQLVDVTTMTQEVLELCGPPAKNGNPTVISMLYSQDKEGWVERAAQRFARLCPNIQVKLTVMGDIASADAILAGEEHPTLWSPADDLVMRYLDYRWKQKFSEVLFSIDRQVSLVQSPLVVLIWEDRLQVLERILTSKRSDDGVWMQSTCPLVPKDPDLAAISPQDMVPGTWIDWYGPLLPPPPKKVSAFAKKAAAKKAEKEEYHAPFPTPQQILSWGRVKFAHTSPSRSASGLEALYLMAYDYALPPKERSAPSGRRAASGAATEGANASIRGSEHLRVPFEDAFEKRKAAFQRWLRRCEFGLEGELESAKLLTDTMFHVGDDLYDGVLTYEHLTFDVLRQIDGHASVMTEVRVLYPEPTIVNQHPVVVMRPADPALSAEHEAAAKWIAFLRSKEMQQTAIEYGFRPATSEVSIRTYDVPENPFLQMRRYGVSFDSTLVEPPRLDGKIIREIVTIWEDATGRN